MPPTVTDIQIDRVVASAVAERWVARASKPRNYTTDLVLEALLELSAATGEDRYARAAWSIWQERGITPGAPIPYAHEPFSNLSFELHHHSGDRRFISPFVAQSRLAQNRTRRSADGLILHPPDDPHGMVLIDATQAYAARMARAGYLTGEDAFFNDACEQLRLAGAVLRDPVTGLWRHSRGDDGTINPFLWSRAQGWAVRGLLETLRYVPARHPGRPLLIGELRSSLEALARAQARRGGWHLLADRRNMPVETSGTGMIAHAVIVARNHGWLADEPVTRALQRSSLQAVHDAVDADGTVHGGCPATGPLDSLAAWHGIALCDNDPHAVAATLLALAAAIGPACRWSRS
jgi:rhamnogalacturonyl hydrolase YesR